MAVLELVGEVMVMEIGPEVSGGHLKTLAWGGSVGGGGVVDLGHAIVRCYCCICREGGREACFNFMPHVPLEVHGEPVQCEEFLVLIGFQH